jgi:hypothetical protein
MGVIDMEFSIMESIHGFGIKNIHGTDVYGTVVEGRSVACPYHHQRHRRHYHHRWVNPHPIWKNNGTNGGQILIPMVMMVMVMMMVHRGLDRTTWGVIP